MDDTTSGVRKQRLKKDLAHSKISSTYYYFLYSALHHSLRTRCHTRVLVLSTANDRDLPNELHNNGPADWKVCASKTAGRNGGLMEVYPPSGHLRNWRRSGGHRCPPFLSRPLYNRGQTTRDFVNRRAQDYTKGYVYSALSMLTKQRPWV